MITEPQLANRILRLLLTQKQYSDPRSLKEHVGSNEQLIADTIIEMNKRNPEWFKMETYDYGDSHLRLIAKDAYAEHIKNFLIIGGYVEDERLIAERTNKESLLRDKQLENLEAVTAQARKAMLDADKAILISWWSLFVAIVAVIVTMIIALTSR